MNPQITVHLQTSNSAAQVLVAQVLHAYTGGFLASPENDGARHGHPNDAPTPDGINSLQDLYCTMMTSSTGGIFDVPLEHCKAVIHFLQVKRPLLNELKTIVVSVSPDPASQELMGEAINALRAAGTNPTDMRILFTDAPEGLPVEEAYKAAFQHARETQITISPEVKLTRTIQFEKLLRFKVPVAAVLNQAIDLETELTSARLHGAPEKFIHALAHKVIAQRELLHSGDALKQIVGAMGFVLISPEEWRAVAPVPNRKRNKPNTVD